MCAFENSKTNSGFWQEGGNGSESRPQEKKPPNFPVFRIMSAQGSEFINVSMKPYLDEYHSVTDNVVPRFDALDKEFASLIEGFGWG